jgi:glycosyl transferase family 25
LETFLLQLFGPTSLSVNGFLRQHLSGVVLNLDQNPQRYERFNTLAHQLPFSVTRISAQDGFLLSEEMQHASVDTSAYKRFYGGKFPGPGTIGCYLSHRMAWKHMVDGKISWMVIFEDDVTFCPYVLSSILHKILTQYAEDIDICSLALRGYGLPLTIRPLPHHRVCVYGRDIYCAGAYVLNLKAATAFLKDSLPMAFQIDDYYTQSWRWNLVFSGIEPRIVSHLDEAVSDIKLRGRRQFRKMQYTWAIFHQIMYGYYALVSIILREYYNTRRLIFSLRQHLKFRWFKKQK